MTTRLENIFRMRSLLDDPYPQRPSLHQLVRQEISEEQDVVNTLNNTGKPWTNAEYTLYLNPNQDTYEISEPGFGKPLFVVRATGNDYAPYIAVPFTDVQDLDYNKVWSGLNTLYQGLFAPNVTPEKMAFYRTGAVDSSYMVKVQPMPMESATYTITYLVGYMGNDDPLSASLLIPEHAHLVQLRGATALLPYAQWHEDAEMNRTRRKELGEAFAYQLQRKEAIFSEYKQSLAHPRMVDIDDWNE